MLNFPPKKKHAGSIIPYAPQIKNRVLKLTAGFFVLGRLGAVLPFPTGLTGYNPTIFIIYTIYYHQYTWQITIIPKPELRWFWGDSLTKPPFRVTSAEVAIICPDQYTWQMDASMFSFHIFGIRSSVTGHSSMCYHAPGRNWVHAMSYTSRPTQLAIHNTTCPSFLLRPVLKHDRELQVTSGYLRFCPGNCC